MIIVQVHPPASEAGQLAKCRFSAYNPDGKFDLTATLNYIEDALEAVTQISTVEIKSGIIEVTYEVIAPDTPQPRWHEWYVSVIDGIMTYVAANFPRRGHEVLSRCPRAR